MSYEFRRDVRTDEQYKKQIEARTVKENASTFAWYKQVILPLSPETQLKETGVDNTGQVIKGKADFHLADFGLELINPSNNLLKLLKFDVDPGFVHLEVKVSPKAKATIKEHNFKTYESKYLDQHFRMLIIINSGDEIDPHPDSEWFLMKIEDFSIFREYGEQVSWKSFGYKPARMLNYNQLFRHFNLFKLNNV